MAAAAMSADEKLYAALVTRPEKRTDEQKELVAAAESSNTGRSATGVEASEHMLAPGDGAYDEKMAELWGGPPPKYFQAAFDEWPETLAAEDEDGAVALV